MICIALKLPQWSQKCLCSTFSGITSYLRMFGVNVLYNFAAFIACYCWQIPLKDWEWQSKHGETVTGRSRGEIQFRNETHSIWFFNSFYHLLQKQEVNSENTSISEVLSISYTCGARVMSIGGHASHIEKVKSGLWERWNKINLQLQDAACKYLNVDYS